MIHRNTIRAACLLIAGALLFTAFAFAGDAVEVTGFGGGTTYGEGGGTHPLYGGSVGFRVADHLHILGEFSVAPVASMSESVSGVNATGTEKFYDFGGGVDYGFGSSKKVVPYVLCVAGVGRQSASATAAGDGITATVSLSSNSPYVGAGGGVRLYAGEHWGIKPEVLFQRYTSNGGLNAAEFRVGLFYQFGGSH
jgi:hypothetical protein